MRTWRWTAAGALVVGLPAMTPHALRTTSLLVVPPPGRAMPIIADLAGVDCPPTGGCLAVGSYQLPGERTRPMAVMRSVGHWESSRPLELPTAADPGSYSTLTAVGCTGPRDCVAVGDFTARGSGSNPGNQLPMADFEVGGRWLQARPISLPANELVNSTSYAHASGVSCAQRSCTIVGTYTVKAGGTRAFLAKASFTAEGELGRAVVAPFRAIPGLHSRTPYVSLVGIACTALGRCQAVGSVTTASGSLSVAVTQTEVGGHWDPESVAPLPPVMDPLAANSSLSGVACASPTSCIAVGTVESTSSVLVDTLGTGGWAWSVAPRSPKGASPTLEGVGCRPSGQCFAVGELSYAGGPIVVTSRAAIASGTSSSLTSLVAVTLPNGGPGRPDGASLRGIACPVRGACVAVGDEALEGGHVLVFEHPVVTTILSS